MPVNQTFACAVLSALQLAIGVAESCVDWPAQKTCSFVFCGISV